MHSRKVGKAVFYIAAFLFAVLSFTVVASVHAAAPTLIISRPTTTITTAGPVAYTVTYSGANVITLSNADVTLNTTGTAAGTIAVSGTGTASRTITIGSISGNGTLGITIAAGTASDLSGNPAAAAGPTGPAKNILVDNTAPVVSAGANQFKHATFTQTATATDANPMTYTWTTLSGPGLVTFGSPTALSTTITAPVSGTYTLRFKAKDIAGNSAFSTMTLTWDTVAPTLVISKPSTTITTTGPVTYTVTYTGADSVTLAGANVTLNHTGTAAGTIATSGTGTASRTITISNISGNGTLGITIAGGTASDLAGNLAAAAGPTGAAKNIIVDNTAPVVSAGPGKIKHARFTQTATATDANGMTYAWTKQDGPGIITFGTPTALATTVLADTDGVYTLRLTATDAAGNSSSGSMTLTWDTVVPTIGISSPSAAITRTGPITYTVTYAGADTVTLANTDVTLNSTGTATGTIAISGTGNTSRTITISNISGNGTLGITIAAGTASDLAANKTAATGPSATFIADNTPPVVSAGPAQIKSTTFTQTATATDANSMTYVWTKQAGPGLVTFGSPTALSTTVSANADGAYKLRFTATDAAGNSVYSNMTLTWDTAPPTVTIGGPSTAATITGPVSYTVTYTGADSVTLTNADVTLNKAGTANGTVSVTTTGTNTRKVKISNITGDGTLGISIAAATAGDLAGNGAAAAGPSGTFVVGAGMTRASLSGTAASGAALAGATVTLKDSLGHILTTTTAGNGTYSLDTSGLTPPFLLVVTTPTQTLYSVSADANTESTINITPLTDLVIRSWYNVQGVPVEGAFADPGSNPPPAPTAVNVISTVVQNTVQLWLNQAGVIQGGFDIISTAFDADHSGIDQVLDQTTVDASTGSMIISNGTVTQDSLVSASTGSVSVVTMTTGSNGYSTSTNGTVVPVQVAQQSALEGITAAFNNFSAAVNSKSTSTLTAGDLMPFLDANGLWSGLTATQWAQEAVYAFSGKTISFSGITIKSLDETLTTADAVFQLSQSRGGQTSTSPQELFFKKVNGVWHLSGDNRIVNVEVRATRVTNQGSSSNQDLVLEVNVDSFRSSPTVTSLSNVTISGGPWTALPLSSKGMNVAPWNSNLKADTFGIYAIDPSISGGELFTVVVTPTSGPTVTYRQTLNALTTEAISITGLSGAGISDAHLGSPQTVNWTLPKTYAISFVRIGTVAYTGVPDDPSTFKCDDMGEGIPLSITSTTAQVTIPDTCNGVPTVQAEIYLQVFGINGELSMVYYTYNAQQSGGSYSISGSVNGAVSNGVQMNLTGNASGGTMTDTGGNYNFSSLPAGTYTVTPFLNGYTFSPPSQQVVIGNADWNGINFTSSAVTGSTYSISGTVTNQDPVSGNILVCVTTDPTLQTFPCNYYGVIASAGPYTVTGIPNGTYYVGSMQDVNGNQRPDSGEPMGLYGSPTAVVVNNGSITGINIAISLQTGPSFSISGMVSGAVNNGVQMNLTGNATGGTMADPGGNYSFSSLPAGTYTVTPSLNGYTFSPPSQQVVITNADRNGINFISSAVTGSTYSISGTVTNQDPVSGNVLVCVTTDPTFQTFPCNYNAIAIAGTYAVTGIPNGAYYVGSMQDVNGNQRPDPGEPMGLYGPPTAVFVNNGSITGINFTISLPAGPTYRISGMVSGAVNNGVQMNLTGNAPGGTMTDPGGNYNFSSLPAGTYTVTPSLNGYMFSPPSQQVVITNADQTGINFTSAMASAQTYSISGTVNYSGNRTGRIYVYVMNPSYGMTGQGTSLAGPGGDFTIRSVQTGTYTILAWMDTLGNGVPNVADPNGSTADFTVNYGDVNGRNLTLTDPTLPAPSVPNGIQVYPMDGGAVIGWDNISCPSNPFNSCDGATAYNIYSGSSSTGPFTLVRTVPETDNGIYFQTGLTNGSTYYYLISSLIGTAESAPSSPSGPITVGGPAGGVSVSGDITFSGSASGHMMYIGMYSTDKGGIYGATIANPASSQSYTISGVQPGTYMLFAFVDMNDNGYFDTGDIMPVFDRLPSITVGGSNMTGQNLVLPDVNALPLVLTTHTRNSTMTPADQYQLQPYLYNVRKMPVKVTITAGPNIPLPYDMAANRQGRFQTQIWIGGTAPVIGDMYTYEVTYSDDTTETLSASVTGVLGSDNMATPLSPENNATEVSATPAFTWNTPAAPLASYTYQLGVQASNGGQWLWSYPGHESGMPSSQTSVLYNVDNNAQQPSLAPRQMYQWWISTSDSDGNQGQNFGNFMTLP